MPQKKGFTLVELLVVIAIIGLIAAISVLALANTRVKSRDSRRVADIKQISTALEVFYSEQDRYPTAEEWVEGQPLKVGNITYLGRIPSAPDVADGDCTADNNRFTYSVSTDGDSYTLGYCLGAKTGSVATGVKCSGPTGSVNGACDGTGMISAGSDGSTVSSRNAQRLADITTIENALSAMYITYDHYYDNELWSPINHQGYSLLTNGDPRNRNNCSTVISLPGEVMPNYDGHGNVTTDPCPLVSNYCIKYIDDYDLRGANCDTGDVYLRNIPLNNYLPATTWTTGVAPYRIYVFNNISRGVYYARIVYRLEGSSASASDHFVNNQKLTCDFPNPSLGEPAFDISIDDPNDYCEVQ